MSPHVGRRWLPDWLPKYRASASAVRHIIGRLRLPVVTGLAGGRHGTLVAVFGFEPAGTWWGYLRPADEDAGSTCRDARVAAVRRAPRSDLCDLRDRGQPGPGSASGLPTSRG